MDKTLLYVGAAGVAAFLYMQHKKGKAFLPSPVATAPTAAVAGIVVDGNGAAAVFSDSGALIPASPATVNRLAAQAESRKAGLTQASKNKRSVAAIFASVGARSLAVGARGGVSVSQTQQRVVAAQQKSTPTKKSGGGGLWGKVKSAGKGAGHLVVASHVKATKLGAKATKKGVDVAAKNPTLASAAAGAVGGPGAAAATRAALAGYSSYQSRGAKGAAVQYGSSYLQGKAAAYGGY